MRVRKRHEESTARILGFLKEEIKPLLLRESNLFKYNSKLKIKCYKTDKEAFNDDFSTYQKIFCIDIQYPENTTTNDFTINYDKDLDIIVDYLSQYDIHYQSFQTKDIIGSKRFPPFGLVVWLYTDDIEFKHLTKKELRKKKLETINKSTKWKFFK